MTHTHIYIYKHASKQWGGLSRLQHPSTCHALGGSMPVESTSPVEFGKQKQLASLSQIFLSLPVKN